MAEEKIEGFELGKLYGVKLMFLTTDPVKIHLAEQWFADAAKRAEFNSKCATNKKWRDIDFMFRYLNQRAGSLRANDREWIIKLEDKFRENDELSTKEERIVTDIFKRY